MNYVREEDIRSIIGRIPYKEFGNKKFLITGANGFMASYVIDTLMYLNQHVLEEKCKVIALCRNLEKAEERFWAYKHDSSFGLIIQSVEDRLQMEEDIDYIFHAAGSSASKVHKAAPVDILRSNIIGTFNLLEYAKDNNISSFLFFSSGSVYGEIPENIKEISEQDFYCVDFRDPAQCYAEGKRSGEALCASYWKQYGLPTKCVRIGHTYGPGIDLNDGHVYSDFVKNICAGENLKITGDGSAVRQFCYIVDAVVAFFLILLHGDGGEVYNLVNRKEALSIRTLAEKLVQEAFPERQLIIECEKMGYSKSDNVEVSTAKLEKLGWYTAVGVVEGFRRTVESFESEK